MPPLRPPTPSEDSDSDAAPETVSLVQSKKSVKKQSADMRKVEVREREKVRLRNRERDRKLKERAAGRRGLGEGGLSGSFGEGRRAVGREEGSEEEEEDGEDVEARMLRAMNDAEDETSEGDDDGESSGSMDEDEDEDEDMSADEVDPSSTHPPNNYLPDELFQAAFSQQANKAKQTVSDSSKKVVARGGKQRKKVSGASLKPKDILIGSRTVRTFQSSKSQPIPSTSNPSAKVNKFLDRTLGLKSQKRSLRRKGWERRPANIGVMRRNGPAAHFVRNQ